MIERGRNVAKHPCAETTRQRRPCPIEADRYRNGTWFCHVHDPEGVFQQQVKAKREGRPLRRRPHCAHCGNSYPKAKHRAICVRFGLNERAAS